MTHKERQISYRCEYLKYRASLIMIFILFYVSIRFQNQQPTMTVHDVNIVIIRCGGTNTNCELSTALHQINSFKVYNIIV